MAILTKLNHKGPLGRSCHAGVKFFFVMANTDKKHLHSSMSASSPSTGNSISDTQTGSSNSKVFLNIHVYLPVQFSEKEIQTNKEKDRVKTKELVFFATKRVSLRNCESAAQSYRVS